MQANVEFDETVVYGPMPPVIVNVAVPPVVGIEAAPGTIIGVIDGTTLSVAEPDFPPTDAVTLKFVSAVTIGAVNCVVAKPVAVLANGVASEPAVEVKLTIVPSGTGSPTLLVTAAEIVDVASEATIVGLANTTTEPRAR